MTSRRHCECGSSHLSDPNLPGFHVNFECANYAMMIVCRNGEEAQYHQKHVCLPCGTYLVNLTLKFYIVKGWKS